MTERPAFTVGMVAYKNYKFIRDALESVFIQDYPNIELIISNDGSDDFNETELIQYLNTHKTANVQSIRINNNKKNMGTCKHLNKVKGMATGKYIMFMAADDAFADSSSISNIVKTFQENSEPFAVCGNCGMYDVDLAEVSEIVPRDEVREWLINRTPLELYKALSTDMFIPTASTTYSMEAFEKLGDFDERIFLVEDWAFFLKMLRSGSKPIYADILVSKHRDGGVCHGNQSGVTAGMKIFHDDEIKIMEIELLPYKKTLGKALSKRLVKRYEFLKMLWFTRYEMNDASMGKKLEFAFKNSLPILGETIKRGRHAIVQRFLTSFRDLHFMASIILLCILYYYDFSPIIGDEIGHLLKVVFGGAAIILGIAFVTGYAVRFLYAIYIPLKNSLKKLFRGADQ